MTFEDVIFNTAKSIRKEFKKLISYASEIKVEKDIDGFDEIRILIPGVISKDLDVVTMSFFGSSPFIIISSGITRTSITISIEQPC